MTESLSDSSSVSRQIYADMRSAFRAYAQNSNKLKADEEKEKEEEKTKAYADNREITKKAFYDIQKAFPRVIDTVNSETKETQQEEKSNNAQINNAQQNQEATNPLTIKVETKAFNFPKSTESIIAELKRNGLNRSLTPYELADKYGISYPKAREILDTINKDSNGFIREYNLPQNSTISFKV